MSELKASDVGYVETPFRYRPGFDTLIKMRLLPGEGDIGLSHEHTIRSSNVHITYDDESVTIFGTGLWPTRIDLQRVTRLEAWIA